MFLSYLIDMVRGWVYFSESAIFVEFWIERKKKKKTETACLECESVCPPSNLSIILSSLSLFEENFKSWNFQLRGGDVNGLRLYESNTNMDMFNLSGLIAIC